MPDIRITVDGKRALTVTQAAAKYRLEPSSMRAVLTRAGDAIEPAAMLDNRTPLYLATALDRLMATRPGRGRVADSTRRALETMSRRQTHPHEFRVSGTPQR